MNAGRVAGGQTDRKVLRAFDHIDMRERPAIRLDRKIPKLSALLGNHRQRATRGVWVHADVSFHRCRYGPTAFYDAFSLQEGSWKLVIHKFAIGPWRTEFDGIGRDPEELHPVDAETIEHLRSLRYLD